MPCNPANLQLRPEWLLTRDAREKALAKRHFARESDLTEHTRPLKPLEIGCVVQIQNQRGPHAKKWDLLGTVVECQEFDAYLIKMDGTGRVTKRNRRFLRPIIPFSHKIDDNRVLQKSGTNTVRNMTPFSPPAHPIANNVLDNTSNMFTPGLQSERPTSAVERAAGSRDHYNRFIDSRTTTTGQQQQDVAKQPIISSDVTHSDLPSYQTNDITQSDNRRFEANEYT
ncbi:MAG: hypothetical protein GY774_30050, partial [Planctomycetes bacterium]|nr:hypothetical protein [Planctomycetota bacterium]